MRPPTVTVTMTEQTAHDMLAELHRWQGFSRGHLLDRLQALRVELEHALALCDCGRER